MNLRLLAPALALVATGLTFNSLAADIVLTPPAAGGVAITNAAGSVTRLRVADDGTITIPGLGAVPVPASGLCVENATGKLGSCVTLPLSSGNGQVPTSNGLGAWNCATPIVGGSGTVTGVTASAPLASSGGTAPDISLTGGVAGQLLAGTAGAPAWTNSPAISGNFVLPTSTTATTGYITKGASRFIHNAGVFNTFVGVDAGNFTMTGSSNTATGQSALQSVTSGSNNTAVGRFALQDNNTGGSNVAMGGGALANNTSGDLNTASGQQAMEFNISGNSNTASGAYALTNNFSGSFNTALGYQALRTNDVGVANTAVGTNALHDNTIGQQNAALGWTALENNFNGNFNSALGVEALRQNTSGENNTAVGVGALLNNSTGFNNTALGGGAGSSLTTGNNNIAIGNTGVSGESGTIRIGTAGGTHSRAFVSGIRGVTTGSANAVAVLIDSNGQLGTVSSSGRFKDDIADMDSATDGLMQLRPVTFHYKTDQDPAGRTLQYGLVAEEVAEVYPGLVARSNDGQVETVMYQFLPTMLLNEVQKQKRTIDRLESELAAIKQALGLRSEVSQ